MRVTTVSSPSACRTTSTVLLPGGKSSRPSMPHVKTTRRGGSTSTYSPRAGLPCTSSEKVPPGRAIEIRRVGDPLDRQRRVREVGEHDLGRRGDAHAGGDRFRHEPFAPLLRVIAFDHTLEAVERVRPELVEHVAHGLQRGRLEAVEPAGALAPLLEQAGPLEHREVLADRLLRQGEVRGDLSGRELGVLNEPDDVAPVRVGERPQDDVGSCGARGVGRVGIRPPFSWLAPARGSILPLARRSSRSRSGWAVPRRCRRTRPGCAR